MATDELKTYEVTLIIRAACAADARELLEEYTGQETHIEVNSIRDPEEEPDFMGRCPKCNGYHLEECGYFDDVMEASCQDCGYGFSVLRTEVVCVDDEAQTKCKECGRYDCDGHNSPEPQKGG